MYSRRCLCDVQRVKDQHVVVVLSQRHHIALWRDLEAAAATHFHVGTLELANERSVTLEHGNVEAVAMTVTNKDVTRVTDVNAIGEVCDVLATNPPQELTILVEDHHTVALEQA